jgi:hypothetical protein
VITTVVARRTGRLSHFPCIISDSSPTSLGTREE